MTDPKGSAPSSRREFLSTTAAAAGATALLGVVPSVHAAGNDTIKIGVIGCGGRGTRAAANTFTRNEGGTIHAMGDLFKDNLENSLHKLKNNENCKGKLSVTDHRCLTRFD